jgi:hypothetical protein
VVTRLASRKHLPLLLATPSIAREPKTPSLRADCKGAGPSDRTAVERKRDVSVLLASCKFVPGRGLACPALLLRVRGAVRDRPIATSSLHSGRTGLVLLPTLAGVSESTETE